MNRRTLTLLVALVPILAFGVLASVVTVPFVALGPGPTFNTLGEIDGKPVVDIEGTDVYPTSGHLNMTTVSQRDQLTLGQAMALWLSGRDQLVPRDLVYPPDKSKEEVEEANTTDFRRSEDSAEYAALQYLDYPMAVTVENVNEDGPSAGKLQAGDAIDFVNGKPVANLEEFQEQLKDTKPGDTVVLDYRRKDGPPGTATITLGKHPERDQGFLGIGVLDAPWAPFSIKFNLANVGGPSAGLMFSLAVIDKLTTGDLNDGQFVAGTGTISGDGKVGSIGGITHKMLAAREAGASLFLVPAENCEEAKSAPQDGLELVRVETLEQAVDALKTLSAGGERPHC
ncbi:YlbL family protein [Mycolicibacterium phlei]|uniref:endopeptidase La n=1 Tax=Mycolicibacterium phlei DSM 43239 = CCUG 21000 TaxID=1226750 RepID=A0A5N5V3D2_MYCPH|nr:PDZ domain-containing protein [Mycolicibacterium phlei]EID13354.1 PDZ domain-containing protein [Mycolicibacterium phlei RIVM601174]KAB7756443.1 signal protein PDZ [Mycolicibacterium phlei DSM 43239 = CCUG 21000]KXW63329.1 signal protein PDZ [Mycolicibacterium phlei DSM 43239 = CCUG 21000]KXW76042.1 signal protein PDZ [Mycolicibacterium phlei DSM 43071]MBF4193600.1 PDZ domain-containing protein [Mycolicibacterium phlei]